VAIHQEVVIPATPDAVFDVLLNSDRFAAMTGGRSADISREAGGAFKMFGGDISGRNVEVVAGKRLVQAWRSGGWPDGVFSLVRFELSADAKGTKLIFDQVGYPDGAEAMLAGGWHQMYWDPMSKMLAS